ncbi:MerR family transcriptional regulator [Enterococcus sp. LJL120]
MQEIFSIDDVAKIFNVAKSSLRYWESEGLISSTRDASSRYRQYTIKDLLEIGDIVFYRKLGIAIEQLRKIDQMSSANMKEVLQNKREDLLTEIQNLEKTVMKIDTNMQHIEKYNYLKDHQYQLEKPDIQYLIDSAVSEIEGTQLFIEDSYNSAIYFKAAKQAFYSGSVVHSLKNDEAQRVILTSQEAAAKTFVTCLLTMTDMQVALTDLDSQLTAIKKMGYQIGATIFGRYLFAAVEDANLGKQEFYKLWVEVKEEK